MMLTIQILHILLALCL